MFYLENMCCLCLRTSKPLCGLSSTDGNGASHFCKIATYLRKIANVLELNSDLLLCEKCCEIIDLIYRFNQVGLKNIDTFLSYRGMLTESLDKTQRDIIVKLIKNDSIKSYKMEEADMKKMCFEEDGEIFLGFEKEADCLTEVHGIEITPSKYKNEAESYLQQVKEEQSASISGQYSQGNRKDGQFNNRESQPDQEDLVGKIAVENEQENYYEEIKNEEINQVKDNTCPICHRKFSFKHNLLTHIRRIHIGGKHFTCYVCKKSFNLKGNLDRHMLIHSDEKPHSCDLCRKFFRTKVALIRHKLVHSGEKPFSCDECDKAFTLRTNLIRHKRMHIDDKPYFCDTCKKA